MKPDIVKVALSELSEGISPHEFSSKSFISIAAGVTLSALENFLPLNTKSIIRVMPNTPCTVGESAAAFAASTRSSSEDKDYCSKIFGAVGTVSEVPEYLMDAVTGLSGSGPACKWRSSFFITDEHQRCTILSSLEFCLCNTHVSIFL